MTLEERIELLESELTKLRGKPVVYATSAYAVARQNCKAYFKSVQGEEQNMPGIWAVNSLPVLPSKKSTEPWARGTIPQTSISGRRRMPQNISSCLRRSCPYTNAI